MITFVLKEMLIEIGTPLLTARKGPQEISRKRREKNGESFARQILTPSQQWGGLRVW